MCVNTRTLEEGYTPPLTIGKIYESNPDKWVYANYYIINDAGFGSWELVENFIPLKEWREKQLNELV